MQGSFSFFLFYQIAIICFDSQQNINDSNEKNEDNANENDMPFKFQCVQFYCITYMRESLGFFFSILLLLYSRFCSLRFRVCLCHR